MIGIIKSNSTRLADGLQTMLRLSVSVLTLCAATLFSGCTESQTDANNTVCGKDVVAIGFRPSALSVFAPSYNNDGWGVSRTDAASATRADAPATGPEVTNPDILSAGTTFRVLVYKAGVDPQQGNPVAENTYKVADAAGNIVATAVDAQGAATADDAKEIFLSRGDYDFYYFSPAVPVNLGMPSPGTYTGLSNGADYMALVQRQSIDPSKGNKHNIPEVCFHRMCSYVDVRIHPREGEILGTLAVADGGLKMTNLFTTATYEIGEYPYELSTDGNEGTLTYAASAFAAEAGSTATVSTVSKGGGQVVLPGYVESLGIEVALTSDGATETLAGALEGYIFEPGYRYVVDLGIGRIADKPYLDITVLPWNEYDCGDLNIGGYFVKSGVISPSNIPADGGTVNLTLTGTGSLPVGGIMVRAISGGNVFANVSVTAFDTVVPFNIPENNSVERTVVFQYEFNGDWNTLVSVTQDGIVIGAIDAGGKFLQDNDPNYMANWQTAIDYCSDLGDGWRLPTLNEMLYYWCMMPSLSGDRVFKTGKYWTGTVPKSPQTYAWNVSFMDASSNVGGKSVQYYVRCMKDRGVGDEFEYPYITISDGGVIVVCKDDNGSLDDTVLFADRLTDTKSAAHNSADNRISRRFRVQKAQSQSTTLSWTDAISYCDNLTEEGRSDWRLPSQREAILLWILGANSSCTSGDKNDTGVGNATYPFVSLYLYQQPGFTAFGDEIYWTAGENDTTSGCIVHYANGTIVSLDKSSLFKVRCVCDEW